MKIGLYFGSFNPIHSGHLIIAENILNFYTDKVWFIVSPQNPFKRNSDLIDVETRLVLIKAAIHENPGFEASDVEFNLPRPSYTINTLQHLKKSYPEHEFFLIIGSDNFLNISNWKSGDKILADYKIIVYQRPNYLFNNQPVSSNITITDAPLINISSTAIRELIKLKKSIKYLVPEKVEFLIEKNKYYR